jgi:hypothetical protein
LREIKTFSYFVPDFSEHFHLVFYMDMKLGPTVREQHGLIINLRMGGKPEGKRPILERRVD